MRALQRALAAGVSSNDVKDHREFTVTMKNYLLFVNSVVERNKLENHYGFERCRINERISWNRDWCFLILLETHNSNVGACCIRSPRIGNGTLKAILDDRRKITQIFYLIHGVTIRVGIRDLLTFIRCSSPTSGKDEADAASLCVWNGEDLTRNNWLGIDATVFEVNYELPSSLNVLVESVVRILHSDLDKTM